MVKIDTLIKSPLKRPAFFYFPLSTAILKARNEIRLDHLSFVNFFGFFFPQFATSLLFASVFFP